MTHSFPTRLSSDLVAEADPAGDHRQQGADVLRRQQSPVGKALGVDGEGGGQQLDAAGPVQPAPGDEDTDLQQMFGSVWERSEEHTSEIQSLMRISYADFCLKKKTNTLHTDI